MLKRWIEEILQLWKIANFDLLSLNWTSYKIWVIQILFKFILVWTGVKLRQTCVGNCSTFLHMYLCDHDLCNCLTSTRLLLTTWKNTTSTVTTIKNFTKNFFRRTWYFLHLPVRVRIWSRLHCALQVNQQHLVNLWFVTLIDLIMN